MLSLELDFIIQQSLELCAKEVFSSVKAEVLEMAVTQKKSLEAVSAVEELTEIDYYTSGGGGSFTKRTNSVRKEVSERGL